MCPATMRPGLSSARARSSRLSKNSGHKPTFDVVTPSCVPVGGGSCGVRGKCSAQVERSGLQRNPEGNPAPEFTPHRRPRAPCKNALPGFPETVVTYHPPGMHRGEFKGRIRPAGVKLSAPGMRPPTLPGEERTGRRTIPRSPDPGSAIAAPAHRKAAVPWGSPSSMGRSK